MGDTVVVRTTSGSVWGEAVRLVEEVRIGQVEGPSELTFGRIVVRDPVVGRLNVDTAGFLYNSVVIRKPNPPYSSRIGLARHAPNGAVLDTLSAPRWDYQLPLVTGRTPSTGSLWVREYPSLRTHTGRSAASGTSGGGATDYAVDLYPPHVPVLRIGRDYTPVPVQEDEKKEHRRYIVEEMSAMIPGWKWNGPDIPDLKAPYEGLMAGQRGRIWVLLHQLGRRLESGEVKPPGGVTPPRFFGRSSRTLGSRRMSSEEEVGGPWCTRVDSLNRTSHGSSAGAYSRILRVVSKPLLPSGWLRACGQARSAAAGDWRVMGRSEGSEWVAAMG